MNMLEITFRHKPVKAVPDKRYRVLVRLVRSDRPRYWNFLCANCGTKLVELNNLEVFAITDFFDPENLNNSGIGKHCKGLLPGGLPCPYSYFFNIQ